MSCLPSVNVWGHSCQVANEEERLIVQQQEAQKRLISQGTYNEKVTLCVIDQNFPYILTDSNLLDATMGKYYK